MPLVFRRENFVGSATAMGVCIHCLVFRGNGWQFGCCVGPWQSRACQPEGVETLTFPGVCKAFVSQHGSAK
eukprot:11192573-Lingulodinium_polyedra.AAC.1